MVVVSNITIDVIDLIVVILIVLMMLMGMLGRLKKNYHHTWEQTTKRIVWLIIRSEFPLLPLKSAKSRYFKPELEGLLSKIGIITHPKHFTPLLVRL